MISNATPPNQFNLLRVITLAQDVSGANRLASALSVMGVKPLLNVDSLRAAADQLRENPIDAIFCEISPECGEGLILPSLLKNMNADGSLARAPSIFWTGKTTLNSPPTLIGLDCSLNYDPALGKLWCKQLGGVSVSALESHARLARAAGITVEIVREGGAVDLSDALHTLSTDLLRQNRQIDNTTSDTPSEDDVINALTTGEGLRFVFQPQYDLQTRRVVGAEALVRWHHPKFGNVPPSVLTPITHRLGLDLLLFSLVETWTIKVLLALKRKKIHIPIAVNASAKTICTPGFSERLAARMSQVDLPANLLKIELTEDIPSPDELYLSASLIALRVKGFQVSMDDLGAGAATLNLLANMSFDEMKIDGSFVRGIEQNVSSRKVIAGMVNWARLLNLNLVAEGIEDERTIPLLHQLGCRVGQGYALSQPLEIDEFLTYLIQQSKAL